MVVSHAQTAFPHIGVGEKHLGMDLVVSSLATCDTKEMGKNGKASSILLFELTCPLDSAHHLEQARSCKQNKVEYHQILTELDRLNVTNFYETLEISVLGHYRQFSATKTYNVLHFIDKDINITKSLVRQMLDDASKICMTMSQRIFMARDCREWL